MVMAHPDIFEQIAAQAEADRLARHATLGSKRIVVVTTNGGSREDGNVYYSWHFVAESDSLHFNERIFNDPSEETLRELELIDSDDTASDAMPKIADHMRSLGYTVHDIPTHIITIGDDN